MKIAVCITGEIRTWNQVKDNIIQNILKDNADVFFVCDEDLSISNIDHEITKELQSFYDESDLEFFNSKKSPETSVENCINMFYKIMKCNELKKQHENKHNFKYDIVVRLRTDSPFRNSLIFSEDKDKIFIPNNCDWGGVCDQFAYGSSDLMDKFCHTFLNIKKYLEEGCRFHPETLLDYHCKKLGLNIIRQDVGFSGIVR
jgi:hypothetical protein